ncbi:hypothetical protein QJS04_geneDACA016002 [Acorus gramineus]|uniref:DUF4378 domain-containing protein n=1 Tax=Acorus gramineus TaxID=55184 RepID=A0AAV9BHG0_ACOGR|nr:hypothetical protein QJS04_geneDACA016002 [Acorus gramineus]
MCIVALKKTSNRLQKSIKTSHPIPSFKESIQNFKSSMAIQAKASPVRRLFELLEDQQEPFLLDIYLLENGFLNKLKNLETSPRCWPCSSPTKSLQRSLSNGLKQRREGILVCSRILRSIFSKLTHGKTKRDPNCNGGFEHSQCVYDEERKTQFSESDRLSLNSSATMSSFSDSTDSGESLSARPSQISIDVKLEREEDNDMQFSPVSVLELSCNEGSPVHSKEENPSISSFNPTNKASEDFPVSESLMEFLFHSLHEKPMWVLKQTKQLLVDCVKESKENNQQKRQGRCCDEETICEEVLLWAKQGGDPTNTAQMAGLAIASSTKEWKQLHDEMDEVGIDIGDAIFEEIIDEVVSDMLDLFCSHRRDADFIFS